MKTLFALMLFASTIADQPRQVLIHYTEKGLAQQQAQMKILDAHQKGLQERDIEVKVVRQDAGADAFTFVLVGRDGGEKLRSKEVVSAEKLFGLIDAMPMRQSEMKRKRD